MSGNARESGRTTASRVLSLLGSFTAAWPILNLSELARGSGVPISTVRRRRYAVGLPLRQISTAGKNAVAHLAGVGGRHPLRATGVGEVVLAFSGPALLREVIDSGLTAYTPHTITMPGRLAQSLCQVRKGQVAISLEEMTLHGSVGVSRSDPQLTSSDSSLPCAVRQPASPAARRDHEQSQEGDVDQWARSAPRTAKWRHPMLLP